MSEDVSDYRRHHRSTPLIKVRYRGECPNCNSTVQATPLRKPQHKQTTAWIRCRECGQITNCDRHATEK